MAYVTDTRGFAFNATDRLRAVVANFAAANAKRRIYRETRNELMALSNRDLNDLGISRSMISSIAKDAAKIG